MLSITREGQTGRAVGTRRDGRAHGDAPDRARASLAVGLPAIDPSAGRAGGARARRSIARARRAADGPLPALAPSQRVLAVLAAATRGDLEGAIDGEGGRRGPPWFGARPCRLRPPGIRSRCGILARLLLA